MTIGALIDVGVDFEYLKTEIGRLGLDGFELRSSRVTRANLSASKFDVLVTRPPQDPEGGKSSRASPGEADVHRRHHDHEHPAHHTHAHRKASDILALVRGSSLHVSVRDRATAIFEKLAQAEGQVHHMPPEDVEFHEVGAIDSIVDVVGTAVGLDALAVEQCIASPVNVGSGFVECQHGIYPVPPPAVANLLQGVPVYSRHADTELVTPTGSAILAATVDRFEPLPAMTIDRVGYGAGTKDLGPFPNCLRLFLGTVPGFGDTSEGSGEHVLVVEANIDDMDAETLAWASEKLLAAGALDVLTIPVHMKKGRAGHVLQIMGRPQDEALLSGIVFEETTTLGLRTQLVARRVLDREIRDVPTPFGNVRVKVARVNGRVLGVSPEYEDCARIARETGEPFRKIRADVLRLYQEGPAHGEH